MTVTKSNSFATPGCQPCFRTGFSQLLLESAATGTGNNCHARSSSAREVGETVWRCHHRTSNCFQWALQWNYHNVSWTHYWQNGGAEDHQIHLKLFHLWSLGVSILLPCGEAVCWIYSAVSVIIMREHIVERCLPVVAMDDSSQTVQTMNKVNTFIIMPHSLYAEFVLGILLYHYAMHRGTCTCTSALNYTLINRSHPHHDS